MMKEALPIWKEVEQESSSTLLTPGALLIFGDPTHVYFKRVLS